LSSPKPAETTPVPAAAEKNTKNAAAKTLKIKMPGQVASEKKLACPAKRKIILSKSIKCFFKVNPSVAGGNRYLTNLVRHIEVKDPCGGIKLYFFIYLVLMTNHLMHY
jgi:hypothetical protein